MKKLEIATAYASELERELERLRRSLEFLRCEGQKHITQILGICKQTTLSDDNSPYTNGIVEACESFREALQEVQELEPNTQIDVRRPIPVRPLLEKIFHWQVQLTGESDAVLRLNLQSEYLDWFPVRFRHVVSNLIYAALRCPYRADGEIRVTVEFKRVLEGYELCIFDNGRLNPDDVSAQELERFDQMGPTGLPVAQFLVEQSCGTFDTSYGVSPGNRVTIFLPNYSEGDHIG